VALQGIEGIDPKKNPEGYAAYTGHLIADAMRRHRESQQARLTPTSEATVSSLEPEADSETVYDDISQYERNPDELAEMKLHNSMGTDRRRF
jgi:hypothetical protein